MNYDPMQPWPYASAGGSKTTSSCVILVQSLDASGSISSVSLPTFPASSSVNSGSGVIYVQEVGADGSQTPAYNIGAGALNVQEVAPATLQTLAVTLLNAVTSTGSSTAIDTSLYHYHTLDLVSTNTTGSNTCNVETSLDNTNWFVQSTFTPTSGSTVLEKTLEGKWNYIRGNFTAYLSGSYTLNYFGGN